MSNNKFIGWNRSLNDVSIKGETIDLPVWGGTQKAVLTTWSEIKKLGFELRDRAFGTLADGTAVLCFMAHEENPYKTFWYVTKETLDELKNRQNTRPMSDREKYYLQQEIMETTADVYMDF